MDLLNSNILITGLSSHQRRVETTAKTETELKVAFNQKKGRDAKKGNYW
jgi:hypothetical protein